MLSKNLSAVTPGHAVVPGRLRCVVKDIRGGQTEPQVGNILIGFFEFGIMTDVAGYNNAVKRIFVITDDRPSFVRVNRLS